VSKSRVAITAGAVFLSAALAVSPIFSKKTDTSPVAIEQNQACAYNCEVPMQLPESITLTCADGGILVTDIEWNAWTINGASGSGTYSENICEPNCADGRRINVAVIVRLSEPFQYKGRNIFQTLEIEVEAGSQLPNGETNLLWNVSEFAVTMNWDI
jgi:hypothetical protein